MYILSPVTDNRQCCICIVDIDRIYDGVEAETRKSQASFRLFSLMRGLPSIRLE